MKSKTLGMVFAPMIWGTWVLVLYRLSLPGYLVTALTSLSGLLALLGYLIINKKISDIRVILTSKALKYIAIVAIFEVIQNALFMVALKIGVDTGSSLIVPVIRSSVGVITPLLGLLVFKENIKNTNEYLYLGMVITIGLLLTIFGGKEMTLSFNSIVILLSLISVIISALQYLVMRKIARHISVAKGSEIATIAVQTFLSCIFILPLVCVMFPSYSSSISWQALVYVSVFGLTHVALAFVLRINAMKHLSAQQSVLLSYIEPVVSICLSIIFLHESISAYSLLGMVLIVITLFASNNINNNNYDNA